MNIEALASIAALLKSSLGSEVKVSRPSQDLTGLVVWPWRVFDNTNALTNKPIRNPDGTISQPQISVEVSFLVLASPAGSDDNINELLKAHQVLLQNPVISVRGSNLQIIAQPLSTVDLTAVFSAAQLKLSLCTNYVVRMVL